MRLVKATLLCMLALSLLAPPLAMASDKPGKGVTLKPARATWNTGFFQEAWCAAA